MLAELDRSWLGKTLIGCTIQSYDPGGCLVLSIERYRGLGSSASWVPVPDVQVCNPTKGWEFHLPVFQPVFRF